MKARCLKCKIEKEINSDNFVKDKHTKSGFTSTCKECRRQWCYKWAKANPEKVKEANLKNKPKRKEFYDSEEGKLCSRKAHLKREYGITLQEYNRMSELQGHVCMICGKGEMNYKNKVLCVDHNHETGQIRGLLCGLCNSGLGKFLESKQLLLNTIKYIEKYESVVIG